MKIKMIKPNGNKGNWCIAIFKENFKNTKNNTEVKRSELCHGIMYDIL